MQTARFRASCASGRSPDCCRALLLPLVLTNFWTGVANQAFIAVIGALALNLLMGTTGQISLGHAGFMAAGAFTVAALITHVEAPDRRDAARRRGRRARSWACWSDCRRCASRDSISPVSTLAAHFVIIVGRRAVPVGDQLRLRLHHPAARRCSAGRSARSGRGTSSLAPAALAFCCSNLNWLRSALWPRLDGDPPPRHRGGVARHQCARATSCWPSARARR